MTTAAGMGLGKLIARRGLVLAALFTTGCIATDRGSRVASPELAVAPITAATSQPVTQGEDSESQQQTNTGWITLTSQTKAAGITGLTLALLMAWLRWVDHREKMQMIARINQEPK